MYCSNCGSKRPEGSAFCPYCGHKTLIGEVQDPIYGVQNDTAFQSLTQSNPAKSSFKPIYVIIGLIPVILILIGITAFLYFRNNTNSAKMDDIKKQTVTESKNKSTEDSTVNTTKNTTKNTEEADIESKLLSVIEYNLIALQEENLTDYLSTLSVTNEELSKNTKALKSIFSTYDLEYSIESMKVLSKSNSNAQVEVVQVTKKISGPAFNDNRTTAVHHLRLVNGDWKIFKTDLVNVEYLKKGNTVDASNKEDNNALDISANSIIGTWEEEGFTNLIITGSAFDGYPYEVIDNTEEYILIEVDYNNTKYYYMMSFEDNNTAMLYLYDSVTDSYSEGSILRKVN